MTSPSPMYYRFPSFRATPPSERTAQQCLAEILSKSDRRKKSSTSRTNEHGMTNLEGKPTKPMLRAEVEEETKQEDKGGGPCGRLRKWPNDKRQEAETTKTPARNKNKSQQGASEK